MYPVVAVVAEKKIILVGGANAVGEFGCNVRLSTKGRLSTTGTPRELRMAYIAALNSALGACLALEAQPVGIGADAVCHGLAQLRALWVSCEGKKEGEGKGKMGFVADAGRIGIQMKERVTHAIECDGDRTQEMT